MGMVWRIWQRAGIGCGMELRCRCSSRLHMLPRTLRVLAIEAIPLRF